MAGSRGDRDLSPSEREWLDIRAYMRQHRHELAEEAVNDFDCQTVAGTSLLTTPAWIPETPVPLDAVELAWAPDTPFTGITGTEAQALGVLPQRPDGSHYRSYADAVGALAAPKVFENRPTYRLLEADFSGAGARMTFARGSYFDSINTGEAAAHDYAARKLGRGAAGLRKAIGNPCDPARRPTNLAISTLTVRHDRRTGDATFLLHWRDPAKVGHAGGLYQVIPVGIFQASGAASWNESNDFSLWRNVIREAAEELAGHAEDHGSEHAPIDYESWPFAARMTQAVRDGAVQAYCLGLGVDPLTFATDLLTVVIIDAPLFDELFRHLASINEEGQVLEAQPFNQATIDAIVEGERLQAAGAATLALAARHKLLDR